MMAWKKRSVICRRFLWFSSRFSPCSSLEPHKAGPYSQRVPRPTVTPPHAIFSKISEDVSWNFSLVKQKLLPKHPRPQESRRTLEKPKRVLNREDAKNWGRTESPPPQLEARWLQADVGVVDGRGPPATVSPGGIHLKADVVRSGDDRSQ